MRGDSAFDVLVLGGGHNGLVAAAYLAKAGRKVCVVERRAQVGGCCVTDSPWPGYAVSTLADNVSLLAPEIQRELRLREYGLELLPRDASTFTPMLDGRSLFLTHNLRQATRELARFSPRDAEAYPKYVELLGQIADALEPVVGQPAPDLFPLPAERRSLGLAKRFRDSGRVKELLQATERIGSSLPAAIEFFTDSVRQVLSHWFESEALRATLAAGALRGQFQSTYSAGTAYGLVHHAFGKATGVRGVSSFVRGGMGRVGEALAAACVDLHVDVRREAEVKRILVHNGKVRGVSLVDGTVLEAPVVASSLDAHVTFERLLATNELPADFLTSVRRIDYSSSTAKLNLALGEAPRFRGATEGDSGAHLRATIVIGSTLDDYERAFDDAKYGWPSTDPTMEVTVPSSVDRSIVPEGKHLLSILVQHAPYRLADGKRWEDIKEDFADRCIAALGRYFPNLPQAVEHRQLLTPVDLERTYGLTGGNLYQGAMSPGQRYALRPALGWADHRTPVSGLYLCGAATHPGGGVWGACGRNAANEILSW